MVAKSSVFWVPFLGWMMWMADYVGIRRGDAASRARMFETCMAHLRRGSSILMFPEGTRSRDGELREFRRGAFSMAIAAGVPVLPIVIEGTLHALPQGTWVFQQDGRLDIRVRVLEPVAPERFAGLVLLNASARYLDDPPDYHGGFSRADVEGLLDMMARNDEGWAAAMAPTWASEISPWRRRANTSSQSPGGAACTSGGSRRSSGLVSNMSCQTGSYPSASSVFATS